MLEDHVERSPDGRLASTRDRLAPRSTDRAKIADELAPVDDAVEACCCEPFDDRLDFTCPVRRERVEVPVSVGEQSGGDRHGHLTGDGNLPQGALASAPTPRFGPAIGGSDIADPRTLAEHRHQVDQAPVRYHEITVTLL